MIMSSKQDSRRAPTHPQAPEEEEEVRTAGAEAGDEQFEPEPPCEHCLAAQAVCQSTEALCEVHAKQSLPYDSPLDSEPTPGPEQQRQDAWILY